MISQDVDNMAEEGELCGLKVIYNNGKIIRPPSSLFPEVPASADFKDGVASKDYVLDPELNVWVRVFVPDAIQETDKSLPLVIYFHGGGFLFFNAACFHFQDLCHQISKKLTAIVVSVTYRLAPEHRLPAAYEDGFTVLKWISSLCSGGVEDTWFKAVNFSKVFVAGDSAGGNLAHFLTVRAAEEHERLSFRLAGQILIQPFFGGVSRSGSEVKLANSGKIITTSGLDVAWRMALPEGSDRDHRYCNVLATLKEVVRGLPDDYFPKTLIIVGNLDLLCDRDIEYGKILEDAGKNVKLVSYKADHGFYAAYGALDTVHTTLMLEEMVNFCNCK